MYDKSGKPGLFSELKRREVFSSAAYYFAIAWGGIEILEWVLERWQISPPEWLMPLLAAALVVGFPVTMLLAWMYDLDRTGIHRTEAWGGRGGATIMLALFLMVGGTGGLYYLIGTPEEPEFVLPPTVRPKLAVLPFDAFSADPEKTGFAEAIHYELLNNLSRLNSIMVISRQSVMEYRDSSKSIPEIALELGVNALLTGAVQRVGDRVRISLSLRDGRSDAQVWSDDFDFRFTPQNYFEVQVRVAESITDEFELALGEMDRLRIGTAPTTSLTAYETYLLGRLKIVSGSVAEYEEAEEMFQEAISLDPEYAPAYAALAGTYYAQAATGVLPFADAIPLAESLLTRALSLDANLVDAYLQLGHIRARRQGRLEEATALYERAVELNPNGEGVAAAYATFLYWTSQGWDDPSQMNAIAEQALAMRRRAVELDPRSMGTSLGLVFLLEDQGHFEEARDHARKVIGIEPGGVTANYMLGIIEIWSLGRYGEGMAYLEKAAQLDPDNQYPPGFMTFAALDLNDETLAAEWANIAWQRTPGKWMSCAARVFLAEFRRDRRADELIPCLKTMIEDPSDHVGLGLLRDLDLEFGQAEQALRRYRDHSRGLFDPAGPKVTKNNLRQAVDLYPVLVQTGHQELAEQLLAQAGEVIRYRPRLSTGGYGWADVELNALRGDTERALDAMRSAIDEGLRVGWYSLAENRNLRSLWDEPRFRAMMSEMEADMAARRDAIKADSNVSE